MHRVVKRFGLPTAGLLVLAAACLGAYFFWPDTSAPKPGHQKDAACVPTSADPAGSHCVLLEYARTPEERGQGLGGRDHIADSEGMLFVFEAPGNHCFWMKDMKFALDIIWLDREKRAVYIQEDVRPDTYPQSFCPEHESLYVIEVNAGVSGWRLGDRIDF